RRYALSLPTRRSSDLLVYLCTKEKKEYPIDTSLSRLAESLPQQFVQVHRAFVINCDYLSEMHRYFGGKYKLLLGRPMIVTVESRSEEHTSELQSRENL